MGLKWSACAFAPCHAASVDCIFHIGMPVHTSIPSTMSPSLLGWTSIVSVHVASVIDVVILLWGQGAAVACSCMEN